MGKRVAVVGDVTTTGGKIITGSGRGFSQNNGIALIGDKAICPKCNSMGQIIEGAQNLKFEGKAAAYDGCVIACACSPVGSNRIIATKSSMFVDIVSNEKRQIQSVLAESASLSNMQSNASSDRVLASANTALNDKSRIRQDAQRLLACVNKLCEKHLFYADIKQAFKYDVKRFSNNIVNQVDHATITYEDGSQKIQEEEDNLLTQSLDWSINGLSIFGGMGMMSTGWALCTTGAGCVIGAPLMLHGANGVYEGSGGVINGVANSIDGKNRPLNVVGPLREFYQDSAKVLGFDASVGSLAYDLIDLGISVRGKLKLVPKINDLGEPVKKLWYYGRQDLDRAYIQTSRKLLGLELYADTLSLINIYEDFNKAFVLDTETQQVSMVVSEPTKISNVKDILDDCSLVVTITGENDDTPSYWICERSNGSKYSKDLSGKTTQDGRE